MGKNIWGSHIWYLFHGLAEKIDEDKFLEQKNNLLRILRIVCYNLPCPECSEHAMKELSKINTNFITSKEKYKQFLLYFHNNVNIRLKKPVFTLEELNNKYKHINILITIDNFKIAYNINNYNEKMITNSFIKNNSNKELFKLINTVLIYCK